MYPWGNEWSHARCMALPPVMIALVCRRGLLVVWWERWAYPARPPVIDCYLQEREQLTSSDASLHHQGTRLAHAFWRSGLRRLKTF